MSWKETCVMSEGVKLMTEHLEGDYGVSRKTVYKWIGRYEKEGWLGLEDRSRAPHRHANAVERRLRRSF